MEKAGSNGVPLPRHATMKCKGVDTKKYIHADKLRGKCHNCDVDKLLKKNSYLKRISPENKIGI